MSFLLFQNFKNSSTFEKFELSNFSITGSKSDSDDKAEFEKNSIIKSLGIILKKNFIMQITTEPYHSAL